jgi:cbb3-type cytochrome oxidase subunit 1
MIPTAILTAVPCYDCRCVDGHLNTGNVRPARLSGVRFGFAPGQVLCKTCYEKHRYRQVVRPRRKVAP